MINLVFFLEERSAQEMLKGLLPKILPDNIYPTYVVFEGKQDLEKQLPLKLRGWMAPNARFVVLRDQDKENCMHVKSRLQQICRDVGRSDTLVRIACTELESWYLGDLESVEQALDITGLANMKRREKFRNPDLLSNAAEELKKITKNEYFKISGSRAIGPLLNVSRNTSPSFKVFVEGIKRLTA